MEKLAVFSFVELSGEKPGSRFEPLFRPEYACGVFEYMSKAESAFVEEFLVIDPLANRFGTTLDVLCPVEMCYYFYREFIG